jgi:hypothetical protein
MRGIIVLYHGWTPDTKMSDANEGIVIGGL